MSSNHTCTCQPHRRRQQQTAPRWACRVAGLLELGGNGIGVAVSAPATRPTPAPRECVPVRHRRTWFFATAEGQVVRVRARSAGHARALLWAALVRLGMLVEVGVRRTGERCAHTEPGAL